MSEALLPKQRIEQLSAVIRAHNIAYHRDNEPTISDAEYDQLFNELVELEEFFPQFAQPDSPTKKLDTSVVSTSGNKVRHLTPMLSIDNTFEPKGVAKFDADMMRLAGGQVEYSAEKKFDGLAVSLIYKNGELVSAATRGDYEEGEDITANALYVKSIPATIDFKGDLDVRGEIMMSTASFLEANRERELAGKKLLANSRNAAAGAIQMKDPAETGRRNLMFQAYAISDATLPEVISQQSEVLTWLSANSFPAEPPVVVRGTEGIQKYFDEITGQRYLLDYDVDGVVYKVNDLALQRRAGFTSRMPKSMLAYKFNQQEACTVIEAIDLQIGRTGALTPVARLKPITLGGVVVENATLHNEDEIQRKDVRVGDVVLVRRGGDVIPGVVSVDTSKRPASGLAEFKMPATCPCCGSAVTYGGEGVDAVARCSGGQSKCGEQRYQQLTYFVSRPAMNMVGVGEELVRKLFNAGMVNTPDQFYDLTTEKIMTLPGYGQKAADNAMEAIDTSRSPALRKFLVSLGIRNAAEGTAKRLAIAFGSMDNILNAGMDQLMAVPDIGPVVAPSLYNYFHNEETRANLDRLMSKIKVQDEERVPTETNFITGKTFVITGTLDSMSRDEAKTWIESQGGKVSGSVSKKTDYLLYGTEAGSKLDKAIELNVSLLKLDELQSILQEEERSLAADADDSWYNDDALTSDEQLGMARAGGMNP